MSASVYGLVFKATIGNPTLKLVLLALADNANDSGYCFPSLKHLIAKSELSKSQVLRYLDKLEDLKLMKRESGVGRGNKSEFWLDIDAIQEKVSPTTPIKEKVSFANGKGVTTARKGVISDAYKEETSEPSKEETSTTSDLVLVEPEQPSKINHEIAKITKNSTVRELASAIWDYYIETFKTPAYKLTPRRAKLVVEAASLALQMRPDRGSGDLLLDALDAMGRSSWHREHRAFDWETNFHRHLDRWFGEAQGGQA